MIMANWVKLNVGGTVFETSLATLTFQPESVLGRMFQPGSTIPPAAKSEDGVYLIDACPRAFDVILNYLRYIEKKSRASQSRNLYIQVQLSHADGRNNYKGSSACCKLLRVGRSCFFAAE